MTDNETTEAKPTFEPRRAKKGQVFGFTSRDGSQVTLRANSEGIVHPQTVEAVVMLDTMGLAVAQTEKSSKKSSSKAPAEEAPESIGPGSTPTETPSVEKSEA